MLIKILRTENVIHDQLPADNQFKLETLLDKIGDMVGCITNVWIHRKKFELCIQKENQSFRSYYAEVIAAANKCEFHKRFCENCHQTARDERILNRIVFDMNNPVARQKLFEEKDLKLAKAVEIIEAVETVRDTERDFSNRNIQVVRRRIKKQEKDASSSKDGERKSICFYCGQNWKPQH